MPTYSQTPIRLQATLISNPPVVPVDANTGLGIQFWRAQSVSLQVGIFDAQGLAVDLSNLTAMQLLISASSGALVPSLVATVTSGSIIPTITVANWNAGTAAQVTFNLSPAQTDFSLNGAAEEDYWLTLVGTLSGGGQIVYAAGTVRIFDPGLPPIPPTGFVSYEAIANSAGNSVVTPASQIHLARITVTGSARASSIVVSAAGLTAGAHVSLSFNLPSTPGIVLNVYDQSTSGTLITSLTTIGGGFEPNAWIELYYDGANVQGGFHVVPSFGGGGGGGEPLSSCAWVDVNGSDLTGIVGQQSSPFATINAALTAISGNVATIYLGTGSFAPVTGDYQAGDPHVINPASKLKNTTVFIGQGRPYPNTADTALIGGSVVQGPFIADSSRTIQWYGCGVDSGVNVCNALYGGAAVDGFGIVNITQSSVVGIGCVLQNVSALGRDATAAFHAILLENIAYVQALNLFTRFNEHGLILKSTNTTVTGVVVGGHAADALIIRSNVGNGGVARDISITGLVMQCIGSLDTQGIVLSSLAAAEDLANITISGASAHGLNTFDINLEGGPGPVTMKNIRIDLVTSAAIRITKSGTYDLSTIVVNGYALNGQTSIIAQDTSPQLVQLGQVGRNDYGYLGHESATGGQILTGSSPYAVVLGTGGAYPTQLFTSNALRASWASTGELTQSKAVTVTGGSGGVMLTLADVSTNGQIIDLYNSGVGTTGHAYIGRTVTASTPFVGNTANALTLGVAGAYVVEVATGNTVRLRVNADGTTTLLANPTISASSPALFLTANDTSKQYFDLSNQNVSTVGHFYFGREVAGSEIFTGSAANSAVIGTGGAYPLQFFTANALRATIAGTGELTLNKPATVLNGSGGVMLTLADASTNSQLIDLYNSQVGTTGHAFIGRAVSSQFTGNTANALTLGVVGAYVVELATTNTVRLRINADGTTTALGNVTVSASFPELLLTATDATKQALALSNSNVGTVGTMYVGREVTGGELFTGSAANSAVLGTTAAYPVQLFTSNTLRASWASTGELTQAKPITITSGNGGVLLSLGESGANTTFIDFYNSQVGTIGHAYVGRGQAFVGNTANALTMGTAGAYPVEFATSNAKRVAINADGTTTFFANATINASSPALIITANDSSIQYIDMTNQNVGTVGHFYFGREVAGGSIFTGSAANSAVIGTGRAYPLQFFTNNALRLSIASDGTTTNSGTIINSLSATPASSSAAGVTGTLSWDASFIYVCTATNTWKRSAIATW